MAATASSPTPTRRRTPIDGHPYPERLLRLVGLTDDVLHTLVQSGSNPNSWHVQRVPLDLALPVSCSCPGAKSHGHCWHQVAGEALRRRFLQIYESQAQSSPEYLAMQVDILDPGTFCKVTITYLSAKRHLDARRQQRAA